MDGFWYQQSNGSIQSCKVMCCWILWAFYALSPWRHWHCVYVASTYLACTSQSDHQHPCLTYIMVIQSSPKNSEGVPWSRGKARQCCQTCYKAKPNAARMAVGNTNFHGNAMNLSEGGSGQCILSRSRIDASTISTMVLIVWLLRDNYLTMTSNLVKFVAPSFNTHPYIFISLNAFITTRGENMSCLWNPFASWVNDDYTVDQYHRTQNLLIIRSYHTYRWQI